MSEDPWQQHLHSETHASGEVEVDPEDLSVPTLTLVWHPSLDRIGESLPLPDLERGRAARLSRLEPRWDPRDGGEARPLADPRLSRQPIVVSSEKEGIVVDATATSTAVRVDGRPVTTTAVLSPDRLEGGVLLALADRILLLLHRQRPSLAEGEDEGLLGRSEGMVRIRREIRRVAPLDVTVLITGESGTGKEKVARAIRDASSRPGPFVAINIAAVPPSLASAELFGSIKGAYSGASQRRDGFFGRADGGTLFLDEIGETPAEVQSLLLRALENGEIQPVGAEETRKVDVRLLAATDADLAKAVEEGRLSAPLFHRLSTFVIEIPPLRERRVDIGSLVLHFLRRELSSLGMSHKLRDPGPYGKPWFPASVVERLMLSDWPGNVRQLLNVVRQLVVRNRDSDLVEIDPALRRWLETDPRSANGVPAPGELDAPLVAVPESGAARRERRRAPAKEYREPGTVEEAELLAALARNRWQLRATASELGVSRASLYGLIERSSKVRKASELSEKEIEHASNLYRGELDSMASALRVSVQGLKLRMRDLGSGS